MELYRPQMKIRRMQIAHWVPKATNTHSEYVIHIALPQQQRLHERASMLGYSTLPVVCLLRNPQSGSEPHTQLPIEWPSLELTPGGKQPDSQANYSPPAQYTGYKLVELYLHSPSFFMTWYLLKHPGISTFTTQQF